MTEDIAALSGCWAVLADGVYFVDFDEGDSGGTWFVKRLNPESGSVTELVRLGAAPVAASCLSVVPDGRWLIYTREDQSGSDLMLVENFR